MHVTCKNCGSRIAVAGRPKGSTSLQGVAVEGEVGVGDGAIAFGPGGKISFGPDGRIGFGPPQKSRFTCFQCGAVADYETGEIKDN